MEARIRRRREVERLTRLSTASIYRQMQMGTFPMPLKLQQTRDGGGAACGAPWTESGAPIELGATPTSSAPIPAAATPACSD